MEKTQLKFAVKEKKLEFMRIDKLLSNLGYGSRKEIKKLIGMGKVEVDGEIVCDPGKHVDPERAEVKLLNKEIEYKKFIYIMLNKPKGVVSSTYDPIHRTVIDILPDKIKRKGLFPVGRLDIDTEGLIIITNDGKTAHEVLSPRHHVPKTYYAEIEGKVDDDDVSEFLQGIKLDDGYKTLPAKLEIIDSSDISKIMVQIYEGKFHQVKRMFLARGKKVVYLKRVAFGGIFLDNTLKPGEARELSDDEIVKIRENGGLKDE